MMLNQELSEKKRRPDDPYAAASFLSFARLAVDPECMASEEIEKLLDSTDFDDQLDANNIKLHRALLLQQLQLRQFQSNTA